MEIGKRFISRITRWPLNFWGRRTRGEVEYFSARRMWKSKKKINYIMKAWSKEKGRRNLKNLFLFSCMYKKVVKTLQCSRESLHEYFDWLSRKY